MSKIEIYDTTLRESVNTLRQSALTGGEVATLADLLDKVGFTAVDAWGGATFDVCMRYLNEDPWARLRMLTAKFEKSPVKILIRGQNLLGYRPVPQDLIQATAKHLSLSGVKMARIFDSLNDIDNLEPVIETFQDVGMDVEGCLVYTQSPVHSNERFVEDAKRLVEFGCRSICITDVAGMLTPTTARDLVSQICKITDVNIHARATTGMASMTYMAAIEAGAKGIDCTIAPFGISSSLPTVEAMLEALVEKKIETNIDRAALKECSKKGEFVALKHVITTDNQQMVENAISVHKISIGMMSGVLAELTTLNALDRLGDVLKEVTVVREDLGWPPLITPISQMISAQAIQNVVQEKRYVVMSREISDYLKGLYGTPPGELNPDLLEGITQVSGRAAMLLPPVMEKAKADLEKEGLEANDERVITYSLFGPLALAFYKGTNDQTPAPKKVSDSNSRLKMLSAYMDKRHLKRLEIQGEDFRVKLVKAGSDKRRVVSQAEDFDLSDDLSGYDDEAGGAEESEKTSGRPVESPLTGVFYTAPSPGQPPFVEPGSEVDADTVVGLVEAMKMFHEVKAQFAGVFSSYAVESGGSVDQGSPVAFLEDA